MSSHSSMTASYFDKVHFCCHHNIILVSNMTLALCTSVYNFTSCVKGNVTQLSLKPCMYMLVYRVPASVVSAPVYFYMSHPAIPHLRCGAEWPGFKTKSYLQWSLVASFCDVLSVLFYYCQPSQCFLYRKCFKGNRKKITFVYSCSYIMSEINDLNYFIHSFIYYYYFLNVLLQIMFVCLIFV